MKSKGGEVTRKSEVRRRDVQKGREVRNCIRKAKLKLKLG